VHGGQGGPIPLVNGCYGSDPPPLADPAKKPLLLLWFMEVTAGPFRLRQLFSISFIFYLYLMLNTYIQRFDMTGNLKNFIKFSEN
jgi:hypothetical protein